jgi:hypothetical protein
MKKSDRHEMPLRENAEKCENNQEMLRQRLADLIGRLLARHWLRKQTQAQDNRRDFQPGKSNSCAK